MTRNDIYTLLKRKPCLCGDVDTAHLSCYRGRVNLEIPTLSKIIFPWAFNRAYRLALEGRGNLQIHPLLKRRGLVDDQETLEV